MPAEAPFAANAEELTARNQIYAAGFDGGDLSPRPRLGLAVVTCMDARLDVASSLGLVNGDAHIIRNAGGVVTDDVVRSLCLSQRALGTREIMVIHHTDCGLQKVTEDSFRAELAAEVGITPTWAVEAFHDPYADVRQSLRRLHHSPFLAHKDHIRGFVYDVAEGRIHHVDLD